MQSGRCKLEGVGSLSFLIILLPRARGSLDDRHMGYWESDRSMGDCSVGPQTGGVE